MFKGWFRWKEVLLGCLVFVWMFLFMVAGGFIFSGSASAQQSTPLTVLQPNGGESWKAGNRYVLKWQSPTNAYNFILQYSTDNKTTWRNIKTVLANNTCNNTGSYLDCKTGWQIPAQDGRKPQSFVRVIARNASNQTIGRDVSDRAFVIEVLRVTSPNGGETLRAGSNHTITWETYALTKQISRVILQYSTDGGSSWKPIKTFVGTNPGNFTWTVPNDPSTNCRVRVVLRDTNGTVIASDVSDRPFTIIGSGSNPSFAISLNPDSLMVPQGGSNTTTLIVTPQNGFTGTITLSLVAGQDRVPEGLTLSPQSVQVTGSSRVSQILTLSASANTPAGTYRLKVRGASGNLTQEADLTVTVSPNYTGPNYTGAIVYKVSSDGSVLVGGALVEGYRKPMVWRINPASLSPGFYWLGAIAQQSTVLDTGVPSTPYGNVLGVTADGQVACGYGSVRADASSGDRALAWDLTTNRPIHLPDHSAGGNVAYACAKSGSDVYIVGRVYPGFPRPTIWKNYTIWHQNTSVWGIFHDITPDASKASVQLALPGVDLRPE